MVAAHQLPDSSQSSIDGGPTRQGAPPDCPTCDQLWSVNRDSRSNEVAMVTSNILPPARVSRPSSTLSARSALSETMRTSPSGYVHLGVAQEIPSTLRDCGIDPDPIIREAGLDPRLFDDGANIVSRAALGRLLTLSVEHTRCPHFGLFVGRRATLLSLGLVGRLMQHSETVGDALRVLVSNLSLQDPDTAPPGTCSCPGLLPPIESP